MKRGAFNGIGFCCIREIRDLRKRCLLSTSEMGGETTEFDWMSHSTSEPSGKLQAVSKMNVPLR
ncbi:hypothetical protein VB694_12545 [Anabaena sp. UHCC 0451]|nr:hypothetical protein [Anabaena sp. UHCC 0451]MEA5577250.1 hypothetical protein [Anabaena sp. UHCC 0451]